MVGERARATREGEPGTCHGRTQEGEKRPKQTILGFLWKWTEEVTTHNGMPLRTVGAQGQGRDGPMVEGNAPLGKPHSPPVTLAQAHALIGQTVSVRHPEAARSCRGELLSLHDERTAVVRLEGQLLPTLVRLLSLHLLTKEEM